MLMFYINAAYAGVTIGNGASVLGTVTMYIVTMHMYIYTVTMYMYVSSHALSCDGGAVHLPAAARPCHSMGGRVPGTHLPSGIRYLIV